MTRDPCSRWSGFTLMCSVAALVSMVSCMSGPRLGSPEYFQELTGLPLELRTPPAYCRWESGSDISAAWVFDFGSEATRPLLSPEAAFWSFPKPSLLGPDHRVVTWKQGRPQGDDDVALQFTRSVVSSVEGHDCGGTFSAVAVDAELASAIGRPSTYFAYKYHESYGHRFNVDFWVLDSAAGKLYMLIEGSGTIMKSELPNNTLHPSPGVGLGADFVRTVARRG